MNYFSGYLANADRRLAAIRARHAAEDAAEITKRNRKSRMGAPLTDDLDGPILSKKNSRGPDEFTRKIAWACEKSHEDMPWKDIARRAMVQTTVLKALVKRYEALGGMVDGAIMNSGELSMKVVSVLAKRMRVAAPCDADLVKWLKTSGGQSFITGISNSATDIKEYATGHGLLQDGLSDLGFSMSAIRRIGKIVGKDLPTRDDVATFFARYPDEKTQIGIAVDKGVASPKCLLRRLREKVPVPDEKKTERRLDALAIAAEEAASRSGPLVEKCTG